MHHAHYLTKTIFIFRHSIKFRLYIAPLCQGRLIMPSLKGKGDRRQAVVGFPTEIFFLHVSVLCQRQHFHSQKAPPPPFPAARALHKYFLLEPVFTRNICGFSSIILLQTRRKCAGGLSVAIHPSATLLCSQAESCLERSRPASIFYAVCSTICRKDTCIRL